MDEHNAFDDDDDRDEDDGYGNLATDVNMDSGDNAGNLGSSGRELGDDGENEGAVGEMIAVPTW